MAYLNVFLTYLTGILISSNMLDCLLLILMDEMTWPVAIINLNMIARSHHQCAHCPLVIWPGSYDGPEITSTFIMEIRSSVHWGAKLLSTKSSGNVPLLGWQLRLLRSGRHRFGRNIRRGWAFQKTVHVNYQIHVTIDKQVAVISVCVWRKNGWPQACRMSPPDHGSNTFQVGSITFQVTWHRLSNS